MCRISLAQLASPPFAETLPLNFRFNLVTRMNAMPYQALARKWRPRTFNEIVGQEHVVRALTHALQFNRMHHAYLFTGTRGVGKTTLARILAKALNCQQRQDFNPCGVCSLCAGLDEGRLVDLIEVDAASRTKVEDTRDLLDDVQYTPTQGVYKIYLIDEVHMLSGHSFNALLKTLEEPPPHVKFLLATTDPQKIPVTVLSRCLQFNLKRLSVDQIKTRMAHILDVEGIEYEPEALRAVARASDGSMRDGLSLLDQAIIHGGGRLQDSEVNVMLGTVARRPLLALVESLLASDAARLMQAIDDLAEHSANFADALQQLLVILHHIALAQWVPEVARRDDHATEILQFSRQAGAEELQLFYQIGLMGQKDLALAPDARMGFEMVLLRMLAFRPDGSLAPHRPAPQPAPPSLRTAPAPPPVDVSVPAPGAVGSSQPGQAATAGTVQAAAGSDWAGMIQAMNLTGITRQLALHCHLHSLEAERCMLVLAAEGANLRTDRLVRNLESALGQHLGRAIKLIVRDATESRSLETPAAQASREQAERQKAAEREIEQDSTVNAFREQFGARIVPGSTQPL